MTERAGTTSIAARLVLLFVLGSGLIIAGVGYTLYHALRMQLESKEISEVRGKTQVVEHILAEIATSDAFKASLHRFRDVSIGHPHLVIGVHAGGAWLVRPPDELMPAASDALSRPPGASYADVRIADRVWWLRTIAHSWREPEPVDAVIVLAINTSETRDLLRAHAIVAALVAVTGTVFSALLGWLIARHSLAPIAQVASRAGEVTAQRLGARLDLKDAPKEVHGLAESINNMLERLEESFHTLEQFSADIAHELRTPLNNLLLQTQVTLSRPRASDEYHDALHSNLVELERLQRMVSDMLFLARAERGMIELTLVDVELSEEARSVSEYFEAAMIERSQTIRIAGQARTRGDHLMIRRALTNLLSNAVRHSPEGSHIDITAGSTSKDVFVAVSNPSPSIPAQELQRIFVRFARRDDSRARQVEGAGLGLAIVDSIMKLHHGAVEAESQATHVCFRLRFPSANGDRSQRAASAPSPQS